MQLPVDQGGLFMCRIATYVGPARQLTAIMRDPAHSLEHQSYAAREMTGGIVAGDGWGVGWYAEDGQPGLMRSILPLWSDWNAKTVLPAVRSEVIVGHVRLASEGSEVCFANTPIFLADDYLMTMNGEIRP